MARYAKMKKPGHVGFLNARFNLVETRVKLCRLQDPCWTEAIEEYTDLLKHRREILGPIHPNTLATQISLANQYGRGDPSYAIKELNEAWELGKDYPTKPIMMSVQHGLGHWHKEAGNFQEAETNLKLAYKNRLEKLGPTHRNTLMTAITIGELLVADRRFAEAQEHMSEVCPIVVVIFGEEHSYSKTCRDLLDQSYCETEKQ